MKRILSIMLTVLMCFSSIFGSVMYVAADGAATYTFSNVDANAGDTVEIPVTYTSAQAANLTALAEITLSSADAEIIGFTYAEDVEEVINVGLSNYDPRTKSIITLFNESQAFNGVLGTLEVKISDNAQDGEIVISASAVAINEDAEENLQTSVVDGTITVGDGSASSEIAVYTIGNAEANPGQTVTVDLRYTSAGDANLSAIAQFELSNGDAEIVGFTFSDEAKAVISQLSNYDPETKSVITLFDDDARAFDGVLGTLQIKVSEEASEGDITITATSRVQNEGVGDVESEVVDGKITVVVPPAPVTAPTFEFGDAQAKQGETVEVELTFDTAEEVNLIALAQINVGDKAEITGFEFDEDFEQYINADLSNYDSATKSLIILFKEAMVFEGSVGKFTVKIADDAPVGELVITASSRVQNEDGEGVIDSEVESGTITVSEKEPAPVPEIESIVVDAEAFEIADADKDNEEAIIAAAKDAIETITVKWTEGKEDTFITTDDVDFDVDTQAKTVTVSYGDFTDVIEYTVADPIILISTVTFGDDDVVAGEIAEVDVILNITENANLIGIGNISFSSDDAEIEEFVFSDEAKAVINDRLSTYEPEQQSIVALFENAMTFNGVLGTLKVKVDADAPEGDITVNARIFNVKNEDNRETLDSEIVPGTISVSENQLPPAPTMYVVTFVVDGVETTIEVEEGTAIGDQMPEDPEKEGYEFTGWTDEDGEAVDADTIVNGDMTVTANFDEIVVAPTMYVVTFVVDGEETTIEVEEGTAIGAQMPEDPEKEGYEFTGWTDEDGEAVDAETIVNGDMTVTANFEEIPVVFIGIEVVDEDGEAVIGIEIPYGTALEDIEDVIRAVIVVNALYDNDTKEEVADYEVSAIDEKGDTVVVISYEGEEVEIAVTFETDDAYIYVDDDSIIVPYAKHNGKTAEDIAEYVAGKVEVTYVDIYGDEYVVEEGYTVVYDGEIAPEETGVATITYEGLEVTVDVTLNKKSSGGGGSLPSGTVIGSGGNVPATPSKPVDPEPVDPEPVDPEPVDPEPIDPIGPSTSELPYSDITKDDWAYEAIKDLYNKGIVNGEPDNKIKLDVGITRQEVAKVVLLGRGFEADESLELNIADPETVAEWAESYVATAMAKAIIKGYEDGSVKGTKIVTRAELAAIIVRSLGATSEFNGSSFTDVTADDWFAAEVECAKSLGIINGYEDGSFRGNQEVTRREAFVMVQRMMKLVEALEK